MAIKKKQECNEIQDMIMAEEVYDAMDRLNEKIYEAYKRDLAVIIKDEELDISINNESGPFKMPIVKLNVCKILKHKPVRI